MSAPDISREACERLAKEFASEASYQKMAAAMGDTEHVEWCKWMRKSGATLRALRAALDAAERERDDARNQANVTTQLMAARGTNRDYWEATAKKMKAERDAADATGYARGVRDAAGVCQARHKGMTQIREYAEAQWCAAAILALLPANKEKNDGA